MRRLAAIQPSFLPWRGYFDIIHKVDVMVFYDDAQYDRRSWRNRNRIKTHSGSQWLTVPVCTKGNYTQPINAILIDNTSRWREKHLRAIHHNYHRATYFKTYFSLLEHAYEDAWSAISDLDIHLTKLIAQELNIEAEWVLASELTLQSRRTDRLVQFCEVLQADHYLSGPTARSYIEPEKFARAGITLEYQVYDYPPYKQLHGAFDPHVSAIDLLFNCGPDSSWYIWGWRDG